MSLEAPSATIGLVWKALNRPPGRLPSLASTPPSIVTENWLFEHEVESAIEGADRRLAFGPIRPKDLADMLGLNWRYIFDRPGSRFDQPSGFEALRNTDVAAIFILLERLGFSVDAEPFCATLRPEISEKARLTWQEVDVLFHHKSQHRRPPISLHANDVVEWRAYNSRKLKTVLGYRIEYIEDDKGAPLSLTAHAPKYRKRPEAELVTCPECDIDYVRGIPSDEKQHRQMHKIRMAVLEPAPDKNFLKAQERDPVSAPWVDHRSPKWKHELMYRRAFAFKREMSYSFSQWSRSPDHDPEPVGFLFSDDDGRVVGAAAFRPEKVSSRPWRLDWIWLAPSSRRQGLLDQHWEQFCQRFGEFNVEPPLSPAMQSFLRKRGLEHLLR